jgi:hypothetical protein
MLMKKLLTLFIFSLAFCNNVNATIANCSNGKCEFTYSGHYEHASSYCTQTLTYEEVETEFLYFIILKTGKKCTVFDSK